MGGLASLVSKVVSKATAKENEVNQLKLPQAECFIAGRVGEENYKEVMDMIENYKKIKDATGDERLETAKKTIMIFPGLTQVFLTEDNARAYLKKPAYDTALLYNVLFKVAVDAQGDLQPMDIKKFLGGDANEEATKMGEGLLQRTKV